MEMLALGIFKSFEQASRRVGVMPITLQFCDDLLVPRDMSRAFRNMPLDLPKVLRLVCPVQNNLSPSFRHLPLTTAAPNGC